MYKSEKRTIFNVVALYLSSTLLLLATIFTSYYFYKQEQLVHDEKEILKVYNQKVEEKLLELNQNQNTKYKYPRDEKFESAIYDIDKNLIFSTFKTQIDHFDSEFLRIAANSYYITNLKPYYLGAAYIVVEKKTLPMGISNDLIAIAIIIVFITIITSFFLIKLILKPLRENLHLLDNFIKDTTHELNTPITTILANIETLEDEDFSEKSFKKFQRIKIASLNISNLYQDLVYLLLNHQVSSKNEDLQLSDIVNERVHYFTIMSTAKNINFELNIQSNVIFEADKQKIERLIDNILSNAIKYTKKSTTIAIALKNSSLHIKDEGKGMSKEEIKTIYEKYTRFDNVQGGFGIGYSIIKSIADEYNIDIEIDSKIDIGTEVILKW